MEDYTKCASCGITLKSIDLQYYNQFKQDLFKLDPEIKKHNLVLCSACTSDYKQLPKFDLIVSAFAH
ncbi:MAG: hypothetical protein ACTSVC_00565, partial [Promethearchaeota archaeon]